MSGKWLGWFAVGLMITVLTPPVSAQNLSISVVRGRMVNAAMLDADTQGPPKTDLERRLAEGNALFDEGRNEEALTRFATALTLATEAGEDADRAYALFRMGRTQRRMYDRTGDVGQLKGAIGSWEQERALYKEFGYTPGFSALAAYDLGQAYLSLARREHLLENARRGLALLEEAMVTFETAEPSYQVALRPSPMPGAGE